MMKDEKWQTHRDAAGKWKDKNREYYLWQKRCLAGRPEYLLKRREQYKVLKILRKIISPHINYDSARLETISRQRDC